MSVRLIEADDLAASASVFMDYWVNGMLEEMIVNKVLDALIEKGESNLKNALLRQSRKKILIDTCFAFAEMSRTSSEYPELIYMKDAIDISTLTEDDLNPALNTETLICNIKEYISKSFVSEKEFSIDRVAEFIALYYKKRALLTVKLNEVSKQINCADERIEAGLDRIQTLLNETREEEEKNKTKHKYIFEHYIQLKVNELIRQLINSTYLLVFKQSITCTGNEDPIRACFKDFKSKIDNDDEQLYDTNYWRKEIEMIVGADEHLNPIIIRKRPFEFIEMFKAEMNAKISEVMKYERMLPESLYYAVMELDMSIKTDVSMKYLNQISKAIENSYCPPDMIHTMLVGWCNRALSMEKYYKEGI